MKLQWSLLAVMFASSVVSSCAREEDSGSQLQSAPVAPPAPAVRIPITTSALPPTFTIGNAVFQNSPASSLPEREDNLDSALDGAVLPSAAKHIKTSCRGDLQVGPNKTLYVKLMRFGQGDVKYPVEKVVAALGNCLPTGSGVEALNISVQGLQNGYAYRVIIGVFGAKAAGAPIVREGFAHFIYLARGSTAGLTFGYPSDAMVHLPLSN